MWSNNPQSSYTQPCSPPGLCGQGLWENSRGSQQRDFLPCCPPTLSSLCEAWGPCPPSSPRIPVQEAGLWLGATRHCCTGSCHRAAGKPMEGKNCLEPAQGGGARGSTGGTFPEEAHFQGHSLGPLHNTQDCTIQALGKTQLEPTFLLWSE